MDHSSAHLTEFTADPTPAKTVASKFTHEQKELSFGKGENHMHNKEQHQQAEYYKQLGEVIRQYDEVILFGPTDAKVELFNILKENHLFANIKIEVKSTDKMTEHQQYEFVKDHFSKKVITV